MYCALSGNVPATPVVSPQGYLFEKSLIVEELKRNGGKCPITKEELDEKDLISIQGSSIVKPRVTSATSIPGLLSLFQNEWDALMLETFTLKQHVETLRQELSQALYQNDAACRVIARLTKERDIARAQLAQLEAAGATHTQQAGVEAMDIDEQKGLDVDICAVIDRQAAELSKRRKVRGVSTGLASVDQISKFVNTKTHTTPSPVTSIALSPSTTSVLAACEDGVARILELDADSGSQNKELCGHKGSITASVFVGENAIITSSTDSTAAVWSTDDEGQWTPSVFNHSAPVSDISLHPTRQFFASVDGSTCSLLHIEQQKCIAQQSVDGAVHNCVEIHPDGLIMATGSSDNEIRIWDVKGMSVAAKLSGHTGGVVSLSFSENGYYLASASIDGTVRLWDLRKLKNLKSLNFDEGVKLSGVQFDHSGVYLGVSAGSEARVYVVKKWEVAASLQGHSADISSNVVFGKDAHGILSAGMDSTVRLWGKE